MTTMLDTIVPKSDQLNADDLIGRVLTITITKIVITGDEQPVAVHFEGDNDKPYRPSKGMRRVMVRMWGDDANAYIGKSMTLYRDDKVTYGGFATGGIRISHMSGIDSEVTMALSESKAKRKPFTVRPLREPEQQDKRAEVDDRIRHLYAPAPTSQPEGPKKQTVTEWLAALKVELEATMTDADVSNILARSDVQKAVATFKHQAHDLLMQMIEIARSGVTIRRKEQDDQTLMPTDDDGWPGPRPEDFGKTDRAADDLDGLDGAP